jgi:hypothetical protein
MLCQVEVQVEVQTGAVTLLFTLLGSGEPGRDSGGDPACLAIPLSQDAAGLAGLARDLARRVVDLMSQELQAQQAALRRATAGTPPAQSPRPPQG